jgi:hypothetical protein
MMDARIKSGHDEMLYFTSRIAPMLHRAGSAAVFCGSLSSPKDHTSMIRPTEESPEENVKETQQ